MAQHRIVCTVQEPVGHPHTDAHIVSVGTGNDPTKADLKWSLDGVLQAMDQGHIFFTKGERSGKTTLVEKYVCAYCQRTYIRSGPDRVEDNNLDSLYRCNWE